MWDPCGRMMRVNFAQILQNMSTLRWRCNALILQTVTVYSIRNEQIGRENVSKGCFQHCFQCILRWTGVYYMSNVQRWSEQMVAGHVWKISEVYQQMARRADAAELPGFWSKFAAIFNIVLAWSFSTLHTLIPACLCKRNVCTHCAVSFCITLSPPLHFNSMSCIHSWTSDHPAVHHNQMILIILRERKN